MSVHDFRLMNTEGPIQTDLCLVGSGPAAYAIADELRGSGVRILILESGGLEPEPNANAFNETENVGASLFNGRDRVLGGTSYSWSGRCVAFTDTDYASRPWVPFSGWPITSETVARYLNSASQILGANPYSFEGREPEPDNVPSSPDIDTSLIRNVSWQTAEPVRFGPLIRADANPHLRVLLHATATHINTHPSNGRLESIEIASDRDKRATVIARAAVLCAGGIENARLLLNSNRIAENGVGNQYDLVGRFLMDHPRDLNMVAHFDSADATRVRNHFGPFMFDNARGWCDFQRGLALSPDVQRREGLLNCAAWPFENVSADDPVDASRRLIKGPRRQIISDVASVVFQPRTLLRGVKSRFVSHQRLGHKVDRIGFVIGSEQRPDPESRVQLSQRRDSLGLPISRVDWRINEQEKASQARLALLMAAEFARVDLPPLQVADWARFGRLNEAVLVDGCHPTGTTRMSDGPRDGVVDAECQVHGVEGLYIAGSSIFPTAGHANPTLMIVAFALRLARQLKRRLIPMPGISQIPVLALNMQERSEGTASLTSRATGAYMPNNATGTLESDRADPGADVERGSVMAVTGATGFIGGRLVERLVDQGAQVTCLLRGSVAGRRLERTGATLRTVDLTDRQTLVEALAGTQVVFHCAYDWANEAWNHDALKALIEACRVNRCRLVYLSSFVVYSIPTEGVMSEETPHDTSRAGYAFTKRALEGELLRLARDEKFPVVVLQPTIVYGPFSRPWTIDPADQLRQGSVVLPDDGEGIANVVYVDDVVRAMILAARNVAAIGERFLISGPPITWTEFYSGMARAANTEGPLYRPAKTLAKEGTKARKILRLASNPKRFLRRLAESGPGRKILRATLRALPSRVRDRAQANLYGRLTSSRRYVNVPDLGRLRFLQSRAVIDYGKARRVIDYVPQFDFAAGMVPTARYLEEHLQEY